jgi:hypothetical protein
MLPTSHTDFQAALAQLKEAGGAMTYESPTPSGPGVWIVWDGDTLKQHMTDIGHPDITIRETTESALHEGGLTDAEIAEVMDGFND